MMKLCWQQTGHIVAVSREHTVYRDALLPLQKEVVVPRRGMKAGRPQTRYYMDDDPREFRSEVELLMAFEINCKKEIP